MNYFIIEEEPVFLKRYGEFLKNTLSRLNPIQFTSAEKGLEAAISSNPAFIVFNPDFEDLDPLLYLERLRKANHPFILLSHEPSHRLVVEVMRLGATDIIDPIVSDEGLVRDILIRTYLEKDRWVRMHTIRCEHLPNPFPGMDYTIQNRVFHPELNTDLDKSPVARLKEGQTYLTVFAGIGVRPDTIQDPGLLKGYFDRLEKQQHDQGGLVWPDHFSSFLTGFVEKDPREVVDLSLEVFADFRDHLVAGAPGHEPILVVDSGEMVFQQDLSTIYSAAINYISHVIKDSSVAPGFYIGDSVFQTLSPFQKTLFPGNHHLSGEEIHGF